jgi:hypothetical protein
MLELAQQKLTNPSNEFISLPHNKVHFSYDESFLDGKNRLSAE